MVCSSKAPIFLSVVQSAPHGTLRCGDCKLRGRARAAARLAIIAQSQAAPCSTPIRGTDCRRCFAVSERMMSISQSCARMRCAKGQSRAFYIQPRDPWRPGVAHSAGLFWIDASTKLDFVDPVKARKGAWSRTHHDVARAASERRSWTFCRPCQVLISSRPAKWNRAPPWFSISGPSGPS